MKIYGYSARTKKGSDVDIGRLRLDHKTVIVNSLLKFYGGLKDAGIKQQAIDYLLSGGDLRLLIDSFKNASPLPIPIGQYSETIKAIGAIECNVNSLVFHVKETCSIQVTIENHSDSVWQTSNKSQTYLSYHWFHDSGSICNFDGLRTPFFAPIMPGEKRVMEMIIAPPDKPGCYQIELTMICEGQYWFEDRGFSSCRLPVKVELQETGHSIRLDENYCLDIRQWDEWVDRKKRDVIKKKYSNLDIVPDDSTLWFCVIAEKEDELATGFSATKSSLEALGLSVKMPVKVVWQTHFSVGSVRRINALAELATLISSTDIVVFVQVGDEIHPEAPAILACSGAFEARFTVFDFWFREGDLARPVFLHGADTIHSQACDYFQSRFALSGDAISKAAQTGALCSLRTLALSALNTDDAVPVRGLLHVPFPLLCAARLSNTKIAMQQCDIVRQSTGHTHKYFSRNAASVSAVICTKDNGHLLRALVRELLLREEISEIVIVSNNTSDEYSLILLDELSRNQRCTVLRYDHPFNFSAQCNLGAKYSHAKHILFINDDVLPVSDDWLATLLHQVESIPDCIVGPLLLYPDQTVQHGGMYIGYRGCAGHAFRGMNVPGGASMFELVAPRQVSCLTGAVLLMERRLYADLNGFDPMMATMLQDVDLSLRALFSGATLVFEPHSILFHMESVSVKTTLVETAVLRRREAEYAYFSKRWASELACDEWINPNLDLQDETWRSLR